MVPLGKFKLVFLLFSENKYTQRCKTKASDSGGIYFFIKKTICLLASRKPGCLNSIVMCKFVVLGENQHSPGFLSLVMALPNTPTFTQ